MLLLLWVFAVGCDLLNGDEEPPPDGGEDAVDENGNGDSLPPDDEFELLVVYTVDGNLWLAEGENPPVSLTSGGNDHFPQFSPDGEYIIFRRNVPPGPSGLDRFELWVIGRDGSGASPLIASGDLPGVMGQPMGFDDPVMLDRLPWQVEWLADSRRVALNTYIEGGYGLSLSYDLWVVHIETGSLNQVLSDGQGGTFNYSPDETRLLVADHAKVTLMNADGSGRTVPLKFELVNTASEYAFVPYPVWTPDGSQGMIAISSPEPFGPSPYNSLHKINLSGEAVMMGTLPGINLIMDDLLWSPDRKRLAYVDSGGDLCLANADGSGNTVYEPDVDRFMGWAPGNEHFIFSKNYGEHVYLGGPVLPAEPFVDFAAVGRVLLVKWADETNYGFLALDGRLRTGELGGETRLIDNSVYDFDIYSSKGE